MRYTCYTKPNYIVNWHHSLLAKEIEDFLEDPKRDRLIVEIGPRRGKTELVHHRLVSYQLGKNPDYKIIGASFSDTLAKDNNLKIQRIMESAEYRTLFPNTRLAGQKDENFVKRDGTRYVRTSNQFDIVNYEGSYRSAGRGTNINGLGADLVIIDDPFSDWKDGSSPNSQKVVLEWYKAVVLNRLTPTGKIIIIHTRWHEADLIGALLEEAKADPDADQWEVICLPEEHTSENEFQHPNDPRTEEGELLWPTRYNAEWVKKRKKSVGSRIWSSLYQQNPVSSEDAIFKPEWLGHDFKQLPEKIDYYMCSVDCAFKDTKKSDYVAITVWAIAGPDKYLVYIFREKADIIKTINEILAVRKHFKIRFTLIEDKANGPAVIQLLKKKIPALKPFPAEGSKESRAQAAAPQFEAGNIHFPSKFSENNRAKYPTVIAKLDIIRDEFKKFMNGGKNDDIVDSTVQMILEIDDKKSWVDDVVRDHVEAGGDKAKSQEQVIADIMGWNIETPTSESSIFDDTEDLFKLE